MRFRIGDVNCLSVTKDLGNEVHFTTKEFRRCVVKQQGQGEDLSIVLYHETPSRFEEEKSVKGAMPVLTYMFGTKIYRQAFVRLWFMKLACAGLIEIVQDDLSPVDLPYMASRLSEEELKAFLGVTFVPAGPCEGCPSGPQCPFAARRVGDCRWGSR